MRVFTTILLTLTCITPTFAKLSICTTTSFVYDLVKSITGDRAEVYYLMGPGVDPHLYHATAQDLRKLSKADMIFYNGLHLEGHMTDIMERLGRQGRDVYAVSDGIPRSKLIYTEGNEAAPDPHVWFDPELWSMCAEEVSKRLQSRDTANAEHYQNVTKMLQMSQKCCISWAEKRLADLPKEKRILITSHDAYNYFGRAFGFQVVGVQGVSTATEAGLADIVSTVEYIKDKKIKAIFVESSVSPSTINRISEDSGAVVGGELYSDSLGTPGTGDPDLGTYEGVFKHNVNTIVEGLK